MLIKIVKSWQLKENQTTAEAAYQGGRRIVKQLGILAATAPLLPQSHAGLRGPVFI